MSSTVRVLGIAGSPRRGGNTDALLDRFLAGAGQAGAAVDQLVACRLDLSGCRACNDCWEDGQCVISDDFQTLQTELIAADVVVLAAPLFFWNLPAQTKALIDRSQCQWARKFLLKAPLAPTAAGHERRRGVLLSVGGDRSPDFAGIMRTVRAFFGVWETDYWADLCLAHIDARGEIERHPTALDQAFSLGVRSVDIVKESHGTLRGEK